MKKSQAFSLDLGLFAMQSITSGLTFNGNVPVDNNANYIEIESHPVHLCQEFFVQSTFISKEYRSYLKICGAVENPRTSREFYRTKAN